MINFTSIKYWWRNIDKLNFILILTLLIIGIILSYSLNNSKLFLNKHLIFSITSLLLMIIISYFDVKLIRRTSLVFLFLFLIILILVLLIDYEVKGSSRWLMIYGFSLQPSEFIKPFFFILSAWCIAQGIGGRTSYLAILLIFFIIICSLIILQPDFGMTFLISLTFFCQLFVAGLSIIFILISICFLLILGISSYYFFEHVHRRINAFLQPSSGRDQIDYSINAFKSGGLFGKGPGQGTLKETIPDANTDFIFAVAGEELGFIFCLLIAFIILIIVIRTLLKILKIESPFEIISLVGLACSFGLQSLFNIFSSIGLIPTKGMTLPFISYGGSSMISSAILFGFILSLTKKDKLK